MQLTKLLPLESFPKTSSILVSSVLKNTTFLLLKVGCIFHFFDYSILEGGIFYSNILGGSGARIREIVCNHYWFELRQIY